MAVERSAVGEDQPRLTLTARPAAALGVVGRRRGNIPQVDQVEIGDVDAQLHGRRTHQVGQPAPELGRLAGIAFFPAEPPLAALALARLDHLGRVLARFERRQRCGRLTIEPLEKRIYRQRNVGITVRAGTPRIHRVGWQRAAVAQPPDQARRIKLEKLVVIHRALPHHEAVSDQKRQ